MKSFLLTLLILFSPIVWAQQGPGIPGPYTPPILPGPILPPGVSCADVTWLINNVQTSITAQEEVIEALWHDLLVAVAEAITAYETHLAVNTVASYTDWLGKATTAAMARTSWLAGKARLLFLQGILAQYEAYYTAAGC